MAEKNLHDIKIDGLDSPKKTPLKNILTLLALLFIILVISVVITKLILNTDEGASIENNDSKVELLNDVNKTADTTTDDKNVDKKDEILTDKIPFINSTITEKNSTSATREPLSSHEPKKMRTYKIPKKNNTSKETKEIPKKTTVIKTSTKRSSSSSSSSSKKNTTVAKKEYIDKVVIKKSTTSSRTTPSRSKHASFLGGKRKDISNSYYIKVGTYRDINTVLNKIKKNNFNYSLVKVENDKTLMRVLVGPFFSHNQATAQLPKVKANILAGAYVTKAK